MQKKLVQWMDYAKIKGVSKQAIGDRMKRGTLSVVHKPVYRMLKFVIIDSSEIPRSFDGIVLDHEQVEE